MYETEFARRLEQLRKRKGVSARDMSLSLGQNAGYINSIENNKSLPRMENFFNICEYLRVTPAQFFDGDNGDPEQTTLVFEQFKRLNEDQAVHILALINDLLNKKSK